MSPRDEIERLLSVPGRSVDADSADAARRFAERAASQGAAEISYATVDTPVGIASVAATSRGVLSVGLPSEAVDDFLDGLAERVSPSIVEAPVTLDVARRELDEYFSGKRQTFDLPLDWRPPRGGHGIGLEPAADRRSLPPDHQERGRPGQLRRRARAEEVAAPPRGLLARLTRSAA